MLETGNDIPLAEALVRLRLRWRFIALAALSGGALGLLLGVLQTPVFRSEALLAPQSSADGGQAQSLARRFSGLANLAGLNLGGSDSNEVEVAIATLDSQSTLMQFVGTGDRAKSILDATHCANSLFCWLPQKRPTAWRAVRELRKYVAVSRLDESGLIRISVEWFDPQVASDWASELVALTDENLRQEAQLTAESRLKFLQDRAANTNIVSVREALSTVMEAELRRLALAGADREFAFKVIDPAVPAELRVRPRRSLIAAALAFVFLFIASFVSLLRTPKSAKSRG